MSIPLSWASQLCTGCVIDHSLWLLGFPGGSAGKESAHNAEYLGLNPGLGRSLREGKGYPLQYSGLENSMDYIVHELDMTEWLSLSLSWLLVQPSSWLRFHFFFLATPHGMWDLSSPTRDQTCNPFIGNVVLTVGPPGKSCLFIPLRLPCHCLATFPFLTVSLPYPRFLTVVTMSPVFTLTLFSSSGKDTKVTRRILILSLVLIFSLIS